MNNIHQLNWKIFPNKLIFIVAELASLTQISQEHALNEILAATTLSISCKYKVTNPISREELLCNNFYMTIAESGDRKSSAQRALLEEYRKAFKDGDLAGEYENNLQNFEVLEASWLRDLKKSRKSLPSMSPPQKRPVHPISPHIFIDDMSQEGLFYKLVIGHPVCGLWSAEGGVFFESIGMSKENAGRLYMTLNKLWSNEEVTSTRKHFKGTKVIPADRAVTLNLAMQESVFYKHVATKNNEEIGFTARLLICQPDSRAGTRLFSNMEDHFAKYLGENTELKKFQRLIASTLITSMHQYQADRVQRLENVQITQEALEYYQTIFDRIEIQQAEYARYEGYKGFASKLFQHILRLSVNMMWIDSCLNKKIELRHAKAAHELGMWYMAAQMRLIKPTDQRVNKTEEWILRVDTYLKRDEFKDKHYVSMRQMIQYPLQRVPKERREEVLEALVDRKIIEDNRYDNKEILIKGKPCKKYITIIKEEEDFGDLKLDANDPEAINEPIKEESNE